jgi:hypothetical protein
VGMGVKTRDHRCHPDPGVPEGQNG